MQQQMPVPTKNHPFSVLVVDDEKDIADSARDVIESMVPNCHVETASSCDSGLLALSKTPFDAVLVDYRMPHQNGLDFIRQARSKQPQVTAILMTAYGSIEMAVHAINDVHVDGFLAKPVAAETLAETVEGALQRNAGPAPEPVIRW